MKTPSHLNRILISAFTLKVALAGVLSSSASWAQLTSNDFTAIPPTISESAQPMIMLALSNDHQIHFKSFTDYDDVDGDGVIDTTYDNSIDYAGYFDSYKCYEYDNSNALFEPEEITTDKYCNDTKNDQWSGNFLNWATMTRIDQVRSIFYGGSRYVDTANKTVLERSYLPNDAHSFAKYYNGSDLGELTPFGNLDVGNNTNEDHGITICNTTRYTGTAKSQNVDAPPLARVVDGNYRLWAANERWQCLYNDEKGSSNGNDATKSGIYAHQTSPSTSDQAKQENGATIGDYVVRVEACVDGLEHEEDCKEYPDGNLKPVGLLQTYGEGDDALWALMSGTYKKNKSGGVLRKDMGSMDDEINVDTNGTFKTGVTSGTIISTIDSFRISNYWYDPSSGEPGTYNSADDCKWGKSSFSNGDCTNWGNPFAEILLECYRYFAGKSPNSNFNTDDSTIGGELANLKTISTWNNPQDTLSACASLNVVAINASTTSYDGDELNGVSDLGTGMSMTALTDIVGAGEGIHGNEFFVGEQGGSNDQLCTPKTISSLGSAYGSCPAAPRLSGSYHAAGLAYAAHTTDLRTLEGDQFVDTYGVTIAPGVPNVNLQVPGSGVDSPSYVSILPACNNTSIGGNCGLVDFQVVNFSAGDPGDSSSVASGSFLVIWEDSEQGGDFDQDMAGVLKYKLTSNQLTITTQTIASSAGDKMGFGYVLGGTTNDGFHAHSGINAYERSETGVEDCSSSTPCTVGAAARSQTYTVGSSAAALLEQPLYYASKWGGFIDEVNEDGSDGDATPFNPDDADDDSQWDSDGDGQPDNYIYATNPIEVKERLGALFQDLLEGSASGTAAAVNAQSGRGVGAVYQAIYTPRELEGSDLVTWTGELRSFFLDQQGRLREDQQADGVLDGTDRVLVFRFDEGKEEAVVDAYNVDTDGSTGALDDTFELSSDSLKPVWSASSRLAEVDQYTDNRDYEDAAESGRYIFTSIDRDNDGIVLSPDFSENNPGQSANDDTAFIFDADNFDLNGTTADDFRYFDLDGTVSDDDVTDLVDFIRGDTVAGMRDRVLTGSSGAGDKNLVLGDIVHSTPVVVSRPADGYDIVYSDDSYADYDEYYENRRVMVYVGANDGMLHAFNGGFYDAASFTYSADAKHELGDEMWAYVPYNVLPHLKWLAEEDYPHVYYVDGAVRAFDVNIFDESDADHPNGWGTILVVGMRFGGGDYSFDHDGNNSTPDRTTRSAYIILDVTNPETPPELIAEITHPDLGYTLSQPEIVKYRAPKDTGTYTGTTENSWHLIFGSGPAGNNENERLSALDDAQSYKTAKTFSFDLINKTLTTYDLGEANSFVGGYEVADWDNSYTDDAIYFGTVGGTAAAPTGKLKRGELSFNNTGALSIDFANDLLDISSHAFSATPKVYRNDKNEYWVYAGTGRFLVNADNLSNQQQWYFGIKDEPVITDLGNDEFSVEYETTVDDADLVDVTEVEVFDDGRVFGDNQTQLYLSAGGDSATEMSTFENIVEYIEGHDGWKFQFEYPFPYTLNNRVRNTTQAGLAGVSLAITAYETTGLVCDVIGDGLLFTPHHGAGVPAPFAPLGTDPDITVENVDTGEPDNELVLQGTLIGAGAPSDPLITRPTVDPSGASAICSDGSIPYVVTSQTATGEVSQTYVCPEGRASGRQSWREIPINW